VCDVNLTLLSLNASTVAELTLFHLHAESNLSQSETDTDSSRQTCVNKDNVKTVAILFVTLDGITHIDLKL